MVQDQWTSAFNEMQQGALLKVCSRGLVVVRLGTGATVAADLSHPLTDDEFDACVQGASPIHPLACEVMLGQYDLVRSRFLQSSLCLPLLPPAPTAGRLLYKRRPPT